MPGAPPPVVAVIDRDRLTAFGLSLLLRDWGYEAVIGETAPEIFARSEGAGRPLSAIVADDRPDAGAAAGHHEAAALARLTGRAIPTVVLVAGDPVGALEELEDGFISVPKPVEPLRLREMLRSMIAVDP